MKGEPAQVAGAERHRIEPAGAPVDGAEKPGPRVEQPQPAVVQPGRVRHRQAAGQHLAGGDVDDAAAIVAAVAPAVGDVAAADRGDVARRPVLHRQAVEMAAVLRRQFTDERRFPHRPEAMPFAGGGETAEQGIDENHPAVGVDGDVVDVEIAGGVADLGNVEPVVALVCLSRCQRVLEPPELIQRGHPQTVTVRAQPHAAAEGALEDRESSVGLQPDQEQLAHLIGGERQAQPLLRQPRGELPGRGKRHLGRRRLLPRLTRHFATIPRLPRSPPLPHRVPMGEHAGQTSFPPGTEVIFVYPLPTFSPVLSTFVTHPWRLIR